jgi:transposase InsO family protein
MYDYSDIHRRLKRNFHYAKCEPRLRARAMTLLRVLASIESGKSVEQATRQFGIKRQYFYFWIRRFLAADYTMEGLKEKSKRPHRSPNATPEDIIRKAEEIRRMEGSGGHTVARVLLREHGIKIAGSTVCSIFKRRGVSKVYRYQKRNEHTKRYAAENPLHTVQTDSAWTGFEDQNGNRVYFFPVIDDCSRVATVHVCDSKSGDEAVRAMERFIACYGIPERVQTDNGVEFTNRYTSRRRVQSGPGTYALFEQFLNSHAIEHRLIRVRTPEHNGKIERFNATIKRQLQRVAHNGMSLAEFQRVIDDYLVWYNKRRPHWSLKGLTPHEKFYGPRLARSA